MTKPTATKPAARAAAVTTVAPGKAKLALLVDGGDAGEVVDLLEHQAIARALAAAIRGTLEDRPLGIGLYGGWGQGKSTIGRLLKTELEDELEAGSFVFVKIDAWKYAHEETRLPLRRHFLLRAYAEAGLEAEAWEMRQHFRFERTSRNLRFSKKDFGQWGGQLLSWVTRWTTWRAFLVVVLIIAVGILIPIGDLDDPLRWLGVIGAAILALLAALTPLLREGIYVTTREDPSWSVEEFDERLSHLLEETRSKVKRFIFFIDDLDRCSDDLVVEAIATLQAFFGRPRCVYVVAADEKQLKRAIRSGSQRPARALVEASPVPADETFLEKIFHVTTHVPRPSLAAIQRYAVEASRDTPLKDLSPAEREGVLTYLVHPRVVSPRQVRVILNEFVVSLAEAKEREAEARAYLPDGELTGFKFLLAKLVVLRAHFPWFYDLLYEDPGLLKHWHDVTLNYGDESEQDPEAAAKVKGAAERAIFEMSVSVSKTGQPDRPDELIDVATAEDLLEALRGYLSLTRDALPKDAAHVQEFLYLRSREEFAELIGEAGERFRLAIEAGDETALRDLARQHPDQAVNAARAAIALAQEANPIQRSAGRRAVTTLLGSLDKQRLADVSEQAAATLYRDEAEAIHDLARDAHGYSLLASSMPRSVIRRYAREPVLEDVTDVYAFAERLVELGENDAWSYVVERAVNDDKAMTVAEALKRMQPAAVQGLVRPTIRYAKGPLEGVTERIDDLGLTVATVDERWLEFIDEESNAQRMWWPLREPRAPDLIAAGAAVRVAAHRDHEGDLVLEHLQTEDGGVLLAEARLPATSNATKEATWLLVERVISHAPPGAGNDLAPLLAYAYQRPEDSERAVELVRDTLNREGWAPGPSLGNALVKATDGRFRSSDLQAIRTLSLLPVELVNRHVEVLIRRAADLASSEEGVPGLASDLERVRQTADAKVLYEAASALKLPERTEARERVILEVLTPAEPRVAGEKLVSWILRLLRVVQDRSTADEDRASAAREMESAFSIFDQVGRREPQAVRRSVRRLPLRSTNAEYAERVLLLRQRIGALRLVLPARFLRTAATASRRAAEASLEHGLQRPRMSPSQIEAVLAGIAKFTPHRRDVERVRRFVQRHRHALSPVEQAAYLAHRGTRHTAERVHGEDLLENIFQAALVSLHAGPSRTERLLGSTQAWSSSPRRVRKQAAAGFTRLFTDVGNEHEVVLVLNGALAFFEDPSRVEGIQAMRRAVKDALVRVSPLEADETRALLERAGTELRLQPSGQRWFDRAVAQAFARGVRSR